MSIVEYPGRPKTRFGLSRTPEYTAWKSVRRGWPDFQEFLEAFGLRPEGCKIGRLDPKKPHGPGNTAWIRGSSRIGKTFGHLLVQSTVRKGGKTFYRCLCNCGRVIDRRRAPRDGSHCGDNVHRVTHGHCRGPKNSPTLVSWERMLTRCYNPESDRYKSYGAKGVRVADRWQDFQTFLADMGERPEGKTLGRILDRGNYEPGNVFWMTPEEQNLARKNNRALRQWEEFRATVRKPPVSADQEQHTAIA